MKKVNLLILSLAVLLAFACGKAKQDDPLPDNAAGTILTQKTCKVSNHHTFDYNSDFTYSYNAAGQVTIAARTSPASGINFTDSINYNSNGNIASIIRHSTNPSTVQDIYTNFRYNANNQLAELRRFTRYAAGAPLQDSDFTLFTYDAAGRILKATNYLSSQPTTASVTLDYFYNPNGDIRVEQYTTIIDQLLILEYTFDDKKDPWLGQQYNPDYWFRFEHNPTRVIGTYYYGGTYYNKHTANYTYTYNTDGYPTQVIGNNDPGYVKSWTYNCQ